MTKKSILILLLLLGAVVPTFARKPAVAVKDRYGVTVGFKGSGQDHLPRIHRRHGI
jgi:hypothetical protein